jgi:hypothetical protein
VRLPLPVDGPAGAATFDAPGPTAGVLTGFLIPSAGPLTSWAPVFSTLGADGRLTEVSTGAWTGPRPPAWLKVVKPGFVVGGFRFLVRTSPEPVQTRQLQVFWMPWTDGTPLGSPVESRVYGAAAGPKDQVRIVELRLPAGAVPTGLWGQSLGPAVVQASLLVRLAPTPTPSPASAPRSVTAPDAPVTAGPGPTVPQVPPVTLTSPNQDHR